MSDVIEATNTASDIAVELVKSAAKGAVYTVAEVGGAVLILVAVGFVAQKLEDRKTKKSLAKSE